MKTFLPQFQSCTVTDIALLLSSQTWVVFVFGHLIIVTACTCLALLTGLSASLMAMMAA